MNLDPRCLTLLSSKIYISYSLRQAWLGVDIDLLNVLYARANVIHVLAICYTMLYMLYDVIQCYTCYTLGYTLKKKSYSCWQIIPVKAHRMDCGTAAIRLDSSG